jgi:hypothetical protein
MILQPSSLADHVVYGLQNADNGLFFMPMIHRDTIAETYVHKRRLLFILFVDGSDLCLAREGDYCRPILYRYSNLLTYQN